MSLSLTSTDRHLEWHLDDQFPSWELLWVRIIAKAALREFWQRYPAAEAPLRKWFSLVSGAQWRGPADVKAMFGSTVDFVADNRIIFDVGGNKHRLIVRVSYGYGQVLIKFVGTHAEYDRIDARTV